MLEASKKKRDNVGDIFSEESILREMFEEKMFIYTAVLIRMVTFTHITSFLYLHINVRVYTVKIICKRSPYLGATELHPIWVNFNPDICVPG